MFVADWAERHYGVSLGHAGRAAVAEHAMRTRRYPCADEVCDVLAGLEPRALAGDDLEQTARQEMLDAWARVVPLRAPTLTEIQALQSMGRHEGFYGRASRPASWQGSNNWGAVQCGHGAPCGDSCFETQDTHADGTVYTWCYKRYATPVDGAADLIHQVIDRRPDAAAALATGDLDAFARALRFSSPVYNESNPDTYAHALDLGIDKITASLGEPRAAFRAADMPAPAPIVEPVDPAAPAEPLAPSGGSLVPLLAVAGGLYLFTRRKAAA